ncbi:MAG: ornithine carbamoyltransferase [Limnochordaceae bacterium]|nr:ornithine carbamoyltransferase [Limnochordaceae bacterium]
MEVQVQQLPEWERLTRDPVATALIGRDFLCLRDFSRTELERMLELARLLKTWHKAGLHVRPLAGRTLAMIFQKPSTRTRVSFEVAMYQLGGHALFLSAQELQLRRGETIEDTGRVLSRYVDAIMIRTYSHDDVVQLAAAATVPVINGLTDYLHPAQALADFLTIQERFGRLSGVQLTYVGDSNNVARSLALGGARLGMRVVLSSPAGYQLDEQALAMAREDARASGGSVEVEADPRRAVAGADVVYTDVWASMGQEADHDRRVQDLAAYQVNRALLEQAAPHVVVMHCLPAHRGEEITDEVIDGPRSIVWDQAENRLHAQKAILTLLLGA